ncbi:unnamed protein product [Ilex paraguariensis]|uniref:Rubredoxin-like domain-containing protein n=1 Tax=Ilex paraguariensis TaxID=185542 RepID=A0ABC8RK00_9AQUA
MFKHSPPYPTSQEHMLFHGSVVISPPLRAKARTRATAPKPFLVPITNFGKTDSAQTQEKTELMASAIRRPTFTFNLSTSLTQPCPRKPRLTFLSLLPRPFPISALRKHPKLQFTLKSIDVSKEDIPISEQPITETPISEQPNLTPTTSESPLEESKEVDKRRLEEKFAVLNTGIYECRSCGYKYDEAIGDPSYPIPPGFPFDRMPEDWLCPTCGAAKSFFESKSVEIAGFAENQQFGFFESKSVEIAGFAENQQFGLGGNSLTSGQKAVLIYGSLLLAFVLFLSGYFLQ